jgi:hypothetical protein
LKGFHILFHPLGEEGAGPEDRVIGWLSVQSLATGEQVLERVRT